MFKFILLAVLCLPTFSWSNERLSAFEDLVLKYERKHSFHGNVLVKEKGRVLYSKSVGLAHVESRSVNTLDSKFMIASLTKSFTAAAILNLENEGQLSVEDSVSDYVSLPKESEILIQDWQKIKIKHLLHHTSGLIRDFKESAFLDRSDFNNLSFILSKALKKKETLFFEPGDRFYYSNFGYLILAAVIEKASSSFYDNYIKANFLFPTKMYNTDEFHRYKVIENMADGYFYNEDRRLRKRCCDDATALRGAASMYSTVEDLSLWFSFLINTPLSKDQTFLEKMIEESIMFEEGQYYGFGLMLDQVEGKNRIYHTGHEWGYVSVMSYYPTQDLEIIVLSNRHGFIGFSGNNAADDLSKEIFKAYLIKN